MEYELKTKEELSELTENELKIRLFDYEKIKSDLDNQAIWTRQVLEEKANA
jgi:hypothetical protein